MTSTFSLISRVTYLRLCLDCQPTNEEYELWCEVNRVYLKSEEIINLIGSYESCSKIIQAAIRNPSDETAQQNVWNALVPAVKKLRYIHQFACELSGVVPKLLAFLCSPEKSVVEHLETEQALFKQFAEIMGFILEFDALKAAGINPENNLSTDANDGIINDEECSQMSLFYAQATPMLHLITQATVQWRDENNLPISIEATTECLASMAHICRGLLSKPELRVRLTMHYTQLLCLRVMTGVIILFDHVDPDGVFRKTSKLDVKSCIRLLKEQDGKSTECLLNAIKFSTLHFNDNTTPRNVKILLTPQC